VTRYDKRFWLLAAGVSAVAGYVDAIGFLKLGGLFVSFMSGNSTRLAVGAVVEPQIALTAGRLLAGFVIGVVAGTILASIAGTRRKPAVLGFVAIFLAIAASGNAGLPDIWTTSAITVAMGAANTVFQRGGEVSIGVTYMTGTLVKLGQSLAGALMGGPRWAWLPYLTLWCGLIAGAVAGALVYPRVGMAGIWAAAVAVAVLAIYAAVLGPVEPAERPAKP
jgi:uncharacterized membrane protein YoaK (UPF0700 family)